MKKIILIILVIVIGSIQPLKAQTDTLAILQNIVANKTNYIGQPFSVLLNQLPIEIKYFFPSRPHPNNRYKEPATKFSFYFPNNVDQLHLTRPCLVIYWQAALNRSASVSLYSQCKGAWSPTIAAHYNNAIISDIVLDKR